MSLRPGQHATLPRCANPRCRKGVAKRTPGSKYCSTPCQRRAANARQVERHGSSLDRLRQQVLELEALLRELRRERPATPPPPRRKYVGAHMPPEPPPRVTTYPIGALPGGTP